MFQMAFFEPYIFSKLHAKNVPSKKICSCLFSNSLTKILNLRDSSQLLSLLPQCYILLRADREAGHSSGEQP